MKGNNKIKVILTSFLLVGALFIWFNLNSSANSILTFTLRQAGLQNIMLEDFSPGLNSSSFSNFSFSYKLGRRNFEAKLADLRISYSFASLINKTFKSIAVSGAEVSKTHLVSIEETDKKADYKLSQIVPELRSLPFDELNITDFDLDKIQRGLKVRSLRIITKAHPAIELKIQFPSGFDHEVDLKANDKKVNLKLQSLFKEKKLACDINADIVSDSFLDLSQVSSCDFSSEVGSYHADFKESHWKVLDERLGTSIVQTSFDLAENDSSGAVNKLSGLYNSLEESLQISLESLNFTNSFLKIRNASLSAALDLKAGAKLIKPAVLGIAELRLGIPISNISASFNFTPDYLSLNSAKADFADGTIELARQKGSLLSSDWLIPVRAKKLSLGKLLSFYPQEGVTAEGEVDLDFTLQKTNRGYQIRSGKLSSSDAGGVIRVIKESFTKSHPELSLVMDQLQEFHFDKLDGALELRDNGEITLALSIRGKNPALNSSRTIILNLKIEDNIFELARTIQLLNAAKR